MAEITAAVVKALRERTGLPMMDCKKALNECNGDAEEAVRWLRERGAQLIVNRSGRETTFGRFGIYASPTVGAIVEVKCESAPVTQNEEFIQLAADLAAQLALGPAVKDADELLQQPSRSKPGLTLGQVKDDMFNRIREVFRVGRLQRIDGPCAAYSHNAKTVAGVLVEYTGGSPELAKDICMHIAAMRPVALQKEDVDPALVEQERAILREAALKEGKPASIVDKMVEGRLRNFYAEKVLLEQQFVKGDKETVGQIAKKHGLQIKRFVHWELGQA